MESYDTIKYSKKGFDNKKYLEVQERAIEKRVEKFANGRLYLEIGGKLLWDAHAQRVLPGFEAENKIKILKSLGKHTEYIFCVNAKDIEENRKVYSTNRGYIKNSVDLLLDIKKTFKRPVHIAVNLVDSTNLTYAQEYRDFVGKLGFKSYFRYVINGYPNGKKILSGDGYGKDEYIHVSSKLIIVTGVASNSGKMSTCLGQVYLDRQKGEVSGYAKYETFPIWNIPLLHPINLAYEAATADIGDYNVIDTYHENEHGVKAVNYNRDLKAFRIIIEYIEELGDRSNYISRYKSPTDMGISMAGFCILDDEIVSIASIREIERRIAWYRKVKDIEATKRCIDLYNKALPYLEKYEYDLSLSI